MQVRRGHADDAEAALATRGPVEADDPGDHVLAGIVEAGIAWVRGDVERARGVLERVRAVQAEHAVALAVEDHADLDWLAGRLAR